MGRDFTRAEDGSTPSRSVLLSDALWRSQFGARHDVLGKPVGLGDTGFTVVGVLPPSFRFPDHQQPELLVPGGYSGPAQWNLRRLSLLRVVGRLPAGRSARQAAHDLQAIGQEHAAEVVAPFYRILKDRRWEVTPLRDKLVGDVQPVLLTLLSAAMLILLITCANLTALQLARGLARSNELAVRLALGGGRRRLVWLLLTESLLLAGAGGLLGITSAYLLLPAARAVRSLHLATPRDLTIDATVLTLATLLALASSLAFGVGPALAAVRLNLNEAMKSGARPLLGSSWSERARAALVAIQLAVAIVLLLGTGLLVRSTAKILGNQLGMEPGGLLTARFRLNEAQYAPPEKAAAFGEDLLDHIVRLPGVQSAALTSALPFTGYTLGSALAFEGRPLPPLAARPAVPIIMVTPDYFQTLRIRLLAGRGILPSDRRGTVPVAVINQSFARKFFGRSDPLATRIRWGPESAAWTQIVGVVADTRHRGRDIDPQPEVFAPFYQAPEGYLALAVRTSFPPSSLAQAVREQFRQIDAKIPIFELMSMNDRIGQSTERRRLELLLLSGFSGLAFLLAVTGVYGVMDYAVTRRTREFGLKLALGANPAQIAGAVVRRGFLLALCGLIPGLALGYSLTGYLESLVYRLSTHDAVTFVSSAGLLLLAAVLASYLPARRAAQIDPARALRWE